MVTPAEISAARRLALIAAPLLAARLDDRGFAKYIDHGFDDAVAGALDDAQALLDAAISRIDR